MLECYVSLYVIDDYDYFDTTKTTLYRSELSEYLY